MTYVLKISKEGYNVLTENNPNNLIFSSEFNTLKYSLANSTNQVSIVVPPYSDGISFGFVYHGLGYSPFFISYVKSNFETRIKPYMLARAPNGSSLLFASALCSSNYIFFIVYGLNASNVQVDDNFTFYTKIYKNNLGL